MIEIPAMVRIPSAEILGKNTGGRWMFRCSICDGLTLRRNRWQVAGAYICPGCATDHNATADAHHAEYLADVDAAYAENDDYDRRARAMAISAMQGFCGVIYPDSHYSPGAEWLWDLHSALAEAWKEGRFDTESDADRATDEIAYSAIPDYTRDRWLITVDLELFDGGDSDLDKYETLYRLDQMTEMLADIFDMVARDGIHQWLNEKREESKCGECGEFPCECCEECGKWICECGDPEV
jgi:hypothetical protein